MAYYCEFLLNLAFSDVSLKSAFLDVFTPGRLQKLQTWFFFFFFFFFPRAGFQTLTQHTTNVTIIPTLNVSSKATYPLLAGLPWFFSLQLVLAHRIAYCMISHSVV